MINNGGGECGGIAAAKGVCGIMAATLDMA